MQEQTVIHLVRGYIRAVADYEAASAARPEAPLGQPSVDKGYCYPLHLFRRSCSLAGLLCRLYSQVRVFEHDCEPLLAEAHAARQVEFAEGSLRRALTSFPAEAAALLVAKRLEGVPVCALEIELGRFFLKKQILRDLQPWWWHRVWGEPLPALLSRYRRTMVALICPDRLQELDEY